MKKVYFVRHAKSSWDDPYLSDHERGLAERGINDAELISKELSGLGVRPEVAFSSDAVRAFRTAEIFLKNLRTDNLSTHRDLYLAGTYSIIHFIYNLQDSFQEIMLFGHNPGFTDLINHFSRDAFENVPTSGVFCVEFQIESWKDIKTAKGNLTGTWFPKDYK